MHFNYLNSIDSSNNEHLVMQLSIFIDLTYFNSINSIDNDPYVI